MQIFFQFLKRHGRMPEWVLCLSLISGCLITPSYGEVYQDKTSNTESRSIGEYRADLKTFMKLSKADDPQLEPLLKAEKRSRMEAIPTKPRAFRAGHDGSCEVLQRNFHQFIGAVVRPLRLVVGGVGQPLASPSKCFIVRFLLGSRRAAAFTPRVHCILQLLEGQPIFIIDVSS